MLTVVWATCSGHVEAAIKSYKQALALRPDFPEATCNLLHTLQVYLKVNFSVLFWRHETKYQATLMSNLFDLLALNHLYNFPRWLNFLYMCFLILNYQFSFFNLIILNDIYLSAFVTGMIGRRCLRKLNAYLGDRSRFAKLCICKLTNYLSH